MARFFVRRDFLDASFLFPRALGIVVCVVRRAWKGWRRAGLDNVVADSGSMIGGCMGARVPR